MSDAVTPAPARACPRCGERPCRPGQRLCGPCHLEYKRARRAAAPPAKETREGMGQETPQEGPKEPAGWETGVPRVVRPRIPLFGKRPQPGPQLPRDWQARFLQYYAERGVRWRAAKFAGVSHDAVSAAERSDPGFARQVENARQEFADSQELCLDTIGQKGNPVGPIVLLKKHRPAEYIEKNMTISASFTTQLDPEEGRALLRAMLDLPPAVGALEAADPDPARLVLDAEPSGPESAQTAE